MGLVETFFNLDVLTRTWPLLMSGLWVTLQLSFVATVASMIWGLVLAFGRLYGNVVVRTFVAIYIDFFRSIPLLVLLIIVYYAFPLIGIRFSPFALASLSLILVS